MGHPIYVQKNVESKWRKLSETKPPRAIPNKACTTLVKQFSLLKMCNINKFKFEKII